MIKTEFMRLLEQLDQLNADTTNSQLVLKEDIEDSNSNKNLVITEETPFLDWEYEYNYDDLEVPVSYTIDGGIIPDNLPMDAPITWEDDRELTGRLTKFSYTDTPTVSELKDYLNSTNIRYTQEQIDNPDFVDQLDADSNEYFKELFWPRAKKRIDKYIRMGIDRNDSNIEWDLDDKFEDYEDWRNFKESANDKKEAGEMLIESQAQEIGKIYRELSAKYGLDFDNLVYGPDGFMELNYPDGFPDFAGDVIWSEHYWNELVDWAASRGINLSEDIDRADMPSVLKEASEPEVTTGSIYEEALSIYNEYGYDDMIEFLVSEGYNIQTMSDRETSGKLINDADYIYTDDMGMDWELYVDEGPEEALNLILG